MRFIVLQSRTVTANGLSRHHPGPALAVVGSPLGVSNLRRIDITRQAEVDEFLSSSVSVPAVLPLERPGRNGIEDGVESGMTNRGENMKRPHQPSRVALPNMCVVAIGLIVACSCQAAEIAFLPGDALFSTRVSEKTFEAADPASALHLQYSQPSWVMPAFCGFAGFWTLELEDSSGNIRVQLKTVFEELRKKFPVRRTFTHEEDAEVTVTVEGFRVLVYSRKYDLNKYGIGFKFNENWPDLPEESVAGEGLLRPAASGLYRPFVRSYEFAIVDWKFAGEVDPLPVIVPPDVNWGLLQARVDASLLNCPHAGA
jgi:hypothetical protein